MEETSMITPMRRFGFNTAEGFLSVMGNVCALLLLLFAIVAVIAPSWFGLQGLYGGMIILAGFASGLLLNLGTGGMRQNRPAFDMSLTFLTLGGLGSIIYGALHSAWQPIVLGSVEILMFFLIWIARREGIRSRFNPRWFKLREFETMIRIADAMLDADDLKLHPIEVAVRTDHLLAEIDSPVKKNIRLVMFLVEWITPLMVFRFVPFSSLGTHMSDATLYERLSGRVVFSVMLHERSRCYPRFLITPIAAPRQHIGYVEFDNRPRTTDLNKSPKEYPLPSPEEEG